MIINLKTGLLSGSRKFVPGGNHLVSLSLDAGGGGGFAQLVLTQE